MDKYTYFFAWMCIGGIYVLVICGLSYWAHRGEVKDERSEPKGILDGEPRPARLAVRHGVIPPCPAPDRAGGEAPGGGLGANGEGVGGAGGRKRVSYSPPQGSPTLPPDPTPNTRKGQGN